MERAEIAQTDLEALSRRLIEQVLAVTGFDVGYVTLRRPGAAMLDQLYVTGRTDRFLAPREVPWDESLCAACRARGIL